LIGRKPVPTKLKILNGNPGKRPLNDKEPLPPAEIIPNCPAHIQGEARKEWKRFVKILHNIGLLTIIDRSLFAAYCQSWGQWVELSEKVAQTGFLIKGKDGVPQVNPYVRLMEAAKSSMQKALSELGMTPTSRTRIKTGKETSKDEFDE
jgi:P27 family predicted phage terminase small subunit